MPSPIGTLVPLCGAHSRRSGSPCKNRAMPNGRCRIHGGKSTGPPLGSVNAITHGIYSSAIRADERAEWDRIPLGSVDDEIRVLKLRLARVLHLQELHLAQPDDASRTKLLDITKTSSFTESGGRFPKRSASIERTRPDFDALILRYTRRISDLESTRRVLNGGDGDDAAQGRTVILNIVGG